MNRAATIKLLKADEFDPREYLLRQPHKAEFVKLAVEAAELVLPVFEQKYPNENRPRKAIEAAKAWLDSPDVVNAANAAVAANNANATWAANNAANAAKAAYATANAANVAWAATAAYAASYAAYATWVANAWAAKAAATHAYAAYAGYAAWAALKSGCPGGNAAAIARIKEIEAEINRLKSL
jgi:hypothetical protein